MIYFVTTNYLKSLTPTNNNVEDNEIVPVIKTSAEFKVKSYIGTYFFSDLLIKFNDQTLNAAEEILVQEFMKPAIAWRAASETILNTTYSLRNKGLQQSSGDFSNSPEFKIVSFMYHHYTDKADYYDRKLCDFLHENREDYPEFMSKLNSDPVVSKNGCDPNINTFNQSILFI